MYLEYIKHVMEHKMCYVHVYYVQEDSSCVTQYQPKTPTLKCVLVRVEAWG